MAAKKSESNSFLAEVIADPDNDIPRLIYADWLEEQGSPRGEFIRVQCELSQISDLDPRWLDLQFRSNELLEKHGEQWAKEIGQDVRKCVYTRGFIETITILARTLQKDGNKLFQSFPVRWIRLNYLKGTADEWKDCTALQHVQYLDLKDLKIPDEDLAAILNSPHLSNLKGLKIGGGGQLISDRVTSALSQPRIASQLEFLEVAAYEENTVPLLNAFNTAIGLPQLRHLILGAVSEFLPRDLQTGVLDHLEINGYASVEAMQQIASWNIGGLSSLRFSNLAEGALQPFLKTKVFESTRSLVLEDGSLSREEAEQLFREQNLQNCREFNLSAFKAQFGTDDSDRFCNLITRHSALRSVRELRLQGLRAGQFAKIIRSSNLVRLECISLKDSVVDGDDFAALAVSQHANSLRRLQFEFMCPTPLAMASLRKGVFPNLITFSVDGRFMYGHSTRGLEPETIAFLESDACPSLQKLALLGVRHSDATLAALSSSIKRTELREIWFDDNRGTNEAMCSVLDSATLTRLRFLSVKGCKGLRRTEKIVSKYGQRLRS